MPRTRLYSFNVTWTHTEGEDPDYRYYEYAVKATTAPRAISKVYKTLAPEGYERKHVRIIDVQNMDIP